MNIFGSDYINILRYLRQTQIRFFSLYLRLTFHYCSTIVFCSWSDPNLGSNLTTISSGKDKHLLTPTATLNNWARYCSYLTNDKRTSALNYLVNMPWHCECWAGRAWIRACLLSQPLLAKQVENIDADVMHAKSTVPLTAVSRPINYNLEKHSLAA